MKFQVLPIEFSFECFLFFEKFLRPQMFERLIFELFLLKDNKIQDYHSLFQEPTVQSNDQ